MDYSWLCKTPMKERKKLSTSNIVEKENITHYHSVVDALQHLTCT